VMRRLRIEQMKERTREPIRNIRHEDIIFSNPGAREKRSLLLLQSAATLHDDAACGNARASSRLARGLS
jgi:hypothetical protein